MGAVSSFSRSLRGFFSLVARRSPGFLSPPRPAPGRPPSRPPPIVLFRPVTDLNDKNFPGACGNCWRGAPSVRCGRLCRLITLFGRLVPRCAGGRTRSARAREFVDRGKFPGEGCEEASDDLLKAPRAEAAVEERSRRFGVGLRLPSSSARRRGPVEKDRSLEVSFASALRPRTRRIAWRGISSSLLWGLVDVGPSEAECTDSKITLS